VSLSAIESRILWLGIEDYTGLWEAQFEVLSVLPDLTKSSARESTRSILMDLARRNLIALYRCVGPPASGQIMEVAHAEIDLLLNQERSWESPQTASEVSVWFGTTDAGESQYWQSQRSAP
jgi:hypothetical protein